MEQCCRSLLLAAVAFASDTPAAEAGWYGYVLGKQITGSACESNQAVSGHAQSTVSTSLGTSSTDGAARLLPRIAV